MPLLLVKRHRDSEEEAIGQGSLNGGSRSGPGPSSIAVQTAVMPLIGEGNIKEERGVVIATGTVMCKRGTL